MKRMSPRVIEIELISEEHWGKRIFIPRIILTPSQSQVPFKFERKQFPLKLCFAMTINKSQGQSVSYVGLDLRSPVFAHGQLYVALSRCTSGHRIRVLFPEGQQGTSTFNVVYPEVLQHILVSFVPHSLFIVADLSSQPA